MFRGVVVLRHAFKIAGFQDVLVSGLKIGKVPGDALLELGDRCIRSGGRLDATFVQLTVVFLRRCVSISWFRATRNSHDLALFNSQKAPPPASPV